jgi:hypothetical protein
MVGLDVTGGFLLFVAIMALAVGIAKWMSND